MAYYKPNLYSLKKQEMLNNIAANSSCGGVSHCGTTPSGEPCGSHQMGNPSGGGCGYTGMVGCITFAPNDGPVCGNTSLSGGCGSNGSGNNPPACGNHHQPPTPSCTTWTNSAQFGGFGVGIGATGANYNQAMAVCGVTSVTNSPPDSGCRPNPSNNGGGCGPIHIGPSVFGINDDAVSIDLDPYTNEIKITAGSAYPIELLAELCRELYT